jgi:long-chain acyl-CoA synthetase
VPRETGKVKMMNESVLERLSIEAAIGDRTVCDLLRDNAEKIPDRPALMWEEEGESRTMTWADYRNSVADVAMGLRELGVAPGDFVAIMTLNRPEHVISDLAVLHLGAIPVSIYNTLAPEQIAYIAGHCAAKVAIVENEAFLEKWAKIHPELSDLTAIVVIDEPETERWEFEWLITWRDLKERGVRARETHSQTFEDYWRTVKPEDVATVVYTSGTTGPPKGVVITHRNVLWTTESLVRAAPWDFPLEVMSYLPLAHVAERMATHYLAMRKGATVHFWPDIKTVAEGIVQVRPTAFLGVPRVWEKLRAGILEAVENEPSRSKQAILQRAIDVGLRAVRLEKEDRRVPLPLRLERAFFEKIVYSKVRKRIGLDRTHYAVSSAAPISEEVVEFFFAIGLPLFEIYGMTEASAPITWNRPACPRIGTVGTAIPGVEIRVDDDGEMLARGGNIAAGYYRDREKTAETIDEQGWLHTGDVCTVDRAGYVRVVDRKKELIITAGGKNISPANLETMLKLNPLIGNACVIGDRRPYLVVLVTLDPEGAQAWAGHHDVPFVTIDQFAHESRVVTAVQEAIDVLNERVSNVEKIRRSKILPVAWTSGSEELTPTLKPKRRVIAERYAVDIDELYAGSIR